MRKCILFVGLEIKNNERIKGRSSAQKVNGLKKIIPVVLKIALGGGISDRVFLDSVFLYAVKNNGDMLKAVCYQ